jgi:hypothetical protein
MLQLHASCGGGVAMRLDFFEVAWLAVRRRRGAGSGGAWLGPGWRRVRAVGAAGWVVCSRAVVRYGLLGTTTGSTRHARRLIGHGVFLWVDRGFFSAFFGAFSLAFRKGIFLEASDPGSAMTYMRGGSSAPRRGNFTSFSLALALVLGCFHLTTAGDGSGDRHP